MAITLGLIQAGSVKKWVKDVRQKEKKETVGRLHTRKPPAKFP